MTFEEAHQVVHRAIEAGHWDDLQAKLDDARRWIGQTFGTSSTEAIRMRLACDDAYWRACLERAEALVGDRDLALAVSRRHGLPERIS